MQFTKSIIIAVLLHVALSATTVKPKPPNKLEQTILNAVEQFRTQMDVGLPEAGVPPLNPLVIPNFDVKSLALLPTNTVKLNVAKVENTVVEGLPNFSVDHLKVNIVTRLVKINFSLPLVKVEGNYEVDGKAIMIIPIYGKGPFKATMHHIHIGASATLAAKDKKMYLEKFYAISELNDFKLRLDGLLGGGSIGELLNNWFDSAGIKIVRALTPKFAEKVSELARLKINDALAKLNVTSIIG